MNGRLRGRCFCGGVQYTIEGEARLMMHCHCSRCRKWSGSAASAEIVVWRDSVDILEGRELLASYEARVFCSRCGSSLFFGDIDDEERPYIGLAAGTLDDDPGIRPMFHIFVGSKAPWETIHDGLPQLEEAEDSRVLNPAPASK